MCELLSELSIINQDNKNISYSILWDFYLGNILESVDNKQSDRPDNLINGRSSLSYIAKSAADSLKHDVPHACYIENLGWISFMRGQPGQQPCNFNPDTETGRKKFAEWWEEKKKQSGNNKKNLAILKTLFKKGFGISHIVRKRDWEGKWVKELRGQNGEDFVKTVLPIVLSEVYIPSSAYKQKSGDIALTYENYKIILSFANLQQKTLGSEKLLIVSAYENLHNGDITMITDKSGNTVSGKEEVTEIRESIGEPVYGFLGQTYPSTYRPALRSNMKEIRRILHAYAPEAYNNSSTGGSNQFTSGTIQNNEEKINMNYYRQNIYEAARDTKVIPIVPITKDELETQVAKLKEAVDIDDIRAVFNNVFDADEPEYLIRERQSARILNYAKQIISALSALPGYKLIPEWPTQINYVYTTPYQVWNDHSSDVSGFMSLLKESHNSAKITNTIDLKDPDEEGYTVQSLDDVFDLVKEGIEKDLTPEQAAVEINRRMIEGVTKFAKQKASENSKVLPDNKNVNTEVTGDNHAISTDTPVYMTPVYDIIAGKYDDVEDMDIILELINSALEKAEADGRYDEFEGTMNQAADHLTELMEKQMQRI